VGARALQTDRPTDGRAIAYSERSPKIENNTASHVATKFGGVGQITMEKEFARGEEYLYRMLYLLTNF